VEKRKKVKMKREKVKVKKKREKMGSRWRRG
jgi:hypothetical protein